jgi:hypothetical protein
MKYEVAYLSDSGHAALLAGKARETLSGQDIHVTDLAQGEISPDGEVYLVGFEVDRGTVPVKIIDALEAAAGKTLFLFLTSGLEPTAEHRAAIEKKLLPFLPDDCDYRGMFLCAGQLPDRVVQNIHEVLRQQPDNEQAKALQKQYQKTYGHPDEGDLAQFRLFLRERLG